MIDPEAFEIALTAAAPPADETPEDLEDEEPLPVCRQCGAPVGGADGTIEMRLMPANNNQMTVRLDGAREVTGIDSATPAPPAADVTLPAGTGQENLGAGLGQTD